MSAPSDKAKSLDEILAEMQAVADAATSGPWNSTAIHSILHQVAQGTTSVKQTMADGEFIAQSRTAVPLLISALRKAIEQRNSEAELKPHREQLLDAEIASILQGRG